MGKPSKKGRSKAPSIRMMAPFSLKCLNCNEYIAQSRKFNVRKETTDKDYLGIKVIRFHARCPRCYGELVFETDPKNSDYQCVSGCKKNYEREQTVKKNESIDEMIARLERETQEDEKMKALKNKQGNRTTQTALGDDTGMEQLEKRLAEQQREKERVEELEELKEKMEDMENRRRVLEGGGLASTDVADGGVDGEKLDQEARDAFRQYNRGKVGNTNNGIMSAYTSSSDSESDSEPGSQPGAAGKLVDGEPDSGIFASKRTQPELFDGIVKRKKPKIIR